MTKKVIKTNFELKKLLEDTRRMNRENTKRKVVYNPTNKLIINGSEVLNYQTSGFPKLDDLIKLLEYVYIKSAYQPILVVVEDSIKYLLESEAEIMKYNIFLKDGLDLRGHTIKFKLTPNKESSIKIMLKLGLSENAKILTNEDIIETYDTSMLSRKFSSFSDKKWQIKYLIKNDEIKIINI